MIKDLVIGFTSAIFFLVVCATLHFAIGITASVLFFIIAFFPWLIATGFVGGFKKEPKVRGQD